MTTWETVRDEAWNYAAKQYPCSGQHMATVFASWYMLQYETLEDKPRYCDAFKKWLRLIVR